MFIGHVQKDQKLTYSLYTEEVGDIFWGYVSYTHLREGEKAEKVGGVGDRTA